MTGEVKLEAEGKRTRTYPILGNLDEMVPFVQDNQMHMVYLALPLRAKERLRQVVETLQDTTASVYFVPDVFTFSLLTAGFTDLRGIPLISLWETPFFGISGWVKRLEDLVLASLILLSVSPIMLLIALGVKLSSPGPIIFKQRRYGLDGHEIVVYKFRTMKVCEDGAQVPQATRPASNTFIFLLLRFIIILFLGLKRLLICSNSLISSVGNVILFSFRVAIRAAST